MAELVESKEIDEAVEVSKLVDEAVDPGDTGEDGVGGIEDVDRVALAAEEADRLRVEAAGLTRNIEAVEMTGNKTVSRLTGIGAGGCC